MGEIGFIMIFILCHFCKLQKWYVFKHFFLFVMNKTEKDISTAIKRASKKSMMPTVSNEELMQEMKARKMAVKFPLHIFPEKMDSIIKSFLIQKPADESFVGLTILSTLSALIGRTILLEQGDWLTDAKLWTVLIGGTSSFKSETQNFWLSPLMDLHDELFEEDTQKHIEYYQKAKEARKNKEDFSEIPPPDKCLFQKDIFMPTLKRKVLMNNPRGFLMFFDEMEVWFSSFEQGKKLTADEKEWLSFHNTENRSAIERSGTRQENLVDSYMALLGGTQHEFSSSYFKYGRQTSGFANRFIFGISDNDNIPKKQREPKKIDKTVWKIICRLVFKKLKYEAKNPIIVSYTKPASDAKYEWSEKTESQINEMDTSTRRTNLKNWVGKAVIHVSRIALILNVLDTVCDYIETHSIWNLDTCEEHCRSQSYDLHFKSVSLEQVKRAIEVVEYSRHSFEFAYSNYLDSVVKDQVTDVTRRIITLINNNSSLVDVYSLLRYEGYKQSYPTFTRYVKKLKQDFPSLF